MPVEPNFAQQWLHHPQQLRLRRLLFRLHMITGISLGLYLLFISLTGSVLVYRNELLAMAMPIPPLSTAESPLLQDAQLQQRALEQYPGYQIGRLFRGADEIEAVEVWLVDGGKRLQRFFDPRTGADMGSASRWKMDAVYTLMELHKSFLAGPAGVRINGIGALALLFMACSGLLLWWPGISRWTQRLRVQPGGTTKQKIWQTHSSLGFWSAAFIIMFAASGAYLCFQDFFNGLADKIQPPSRETAGNRFVDHLLYLLAFLHFGRLNGIALPCDGPGLCDQSFKALWAVFGAAPAVMFITGFTMWLGRNKE